MSDRYVVTMTSGDTSITYDGRATDAVRAFYVLLVAEVSNGS